MSSISFSSPARAVAVISKGAVRHTNSLSLLAEIAAHHQCHPPTPINHHALVAFTKQFVASADSFFNPEPLVVHPICSISDSRIIEEPNSSPLEAYQVRKKKVNGIRYLHRPLISPFRRVLSGQIVKGRQDVYPLLSSIACPLHSVYALVLVVVLSPSLTPHAPSLTGSDAICVGCCYCRASIRHRRHKGENCGGSSAILLRRLLPNLGGGITVV